MSAIPEFLRQTYANFQEKEANFLLLELLPLYVKTCLEKMSRNGAKIAYVVYKFWLFQEVKFADVFSLKTFFKNLILKYVKYATLLKYVTDVWNNYGVNSV
jgi:hypothetical protein